MKHESIVFSLTILSLTMLCGVFQTHAAENSDEGGKVAVVNGTVISQKQFDREMIPVQENIEASGKSLSAADLARVKQMVLEEIIRNELLYQECMKNNIEITDEEINKKYEDIKSQFSSDAEFQQRLRELNNSEELYKSQIKRALAIQRLINQKFKPTVTDKEIRKYYDDNPDQFKQKSQVRASHILISVNPGATGAQKEAARKEIEALLARVKSGEDFAAIAKGKSQCPSSANGGDLGFFAKGETVKPFEDAAFSMKPGEISNIVETQFGYHIIKLTDKMDEKIIEFEGAKEEISKTLKKGEIRDSYNKFYTDLRNNAKVDIFLKE
jgi:peptidyl-prolyl cis-trans isomerase C